MNEYQKQVLTIVDKIREEISLDEFENSTIAELASELTNLVGEPEYAD